MATGTQSVPRARWIEFLDELTIEAGLVVRIDDLRPPLVWTLRSADFDPFDHVVEILLDNGHERLRVLLDDPAAIEFEGSPGSPTMLRVVTPAGDFLASMEDRRPITTARERPLAQAG